MCNLVGLAFSVGGVLLLFYYALPEAPAGGTAMYSFGPGPYEGPGFEVELQRYHTLAHIGLALVLIGTLLEAVPPFCTALGSWRRRR